MDLHDLNNKDAKSGLTACVCKNTAVACTDVLDKVSEHMYVAMVLKKYKSIQAIKHIYILVRDGPILVLVSVSIKR